MLENMYITKEHCPETHRLLYDCFQTCTINTWSTKRLLPLIGLYLDATDQ